MQTEGTIEPQKFNNFQTATYRYGAVIIVRSEHTLLSSTSHMTTKLGIKYDNTYLK